MNEVHIVERAFQLARSGLCATQRDVERALHIEGYPLSDVRGHLAGASLQKQLGALMIASAAPVYLGG